MNPNPLAEFLGQLRHFVLEEAENARQKAQRIWQKPLAQRLAEGYAIDRVSISQMKEGHVTLLCPRNESRFREGDILCLNRGNLSQEPRYMVSLEFDAETTLRVTSDDPSLNWGKVVQEPTGWVLDVGYLDLTHWFMAALNDTGEMLIGRERILPLLLGQKPPHNLDSARFNQGLEMGEVWGLNPAQTEALAEAYASEWISLIQGPPGTGKTQVLAHLAHVLASDGERVLVTSFTHRAINHALNKIAEVSGGDVAVYKIGRDSRTDDLELENYPSFTSCPVSESREGYILGATPFATRTQRLHGVEFDTIIFDEASQITLPLAILAMLSGKKYVFIGDHKQLPPVLATNRREDGLHQSVFEWLANRIANPITLTTTYRLNEELTVWPSAQFYDGELVADESAAQRRLQFAHSPQRLWHILDPQKTKVFVDLQHRNATRQSYQEANMVVDLILALLDGGVPPTEIGVIAPFRSQGRVIRNLLRRHLAEESTREALVTDTVERMQGQERDVVILSLTTSQPTYAADLASFYFQPQRLNVAITRPRKKLIIVGSSHVLNAQPEEGEDREAVRLLKSLLGSCHYVVGHSLLS